MIEKINVIQIMIRLQRYSAILFFEPFQDFISTHLLIRTPIVSFFSYPKNARLSKRGISIDILFMVSMRDKHEKEDSLIAVLQPKVSTAQKNVGKERWRMLLSLDVKFVRSISPSNLHRVSLLVQRVWRRPIPSCLANQWCPLMVSLIRTMKSNWLLSISERFLSQRQFQYNKQKFKTSILKMSIILISTKQKPKSGVFHNKLKLTHTL